MLKPVLGTQLNIGHPLSKGLVGSWLMNEGSGNITGDLSLNGNTGSINGATWAGGQDGLALAFDGDNDEVSLGDKSTYPTDGDLSISILIKPEVWDADGTLVRRNAGLTTWDLDINDGDEIRIFRSTTLTTTFPVATLSLGTWIHIAVTSTNSTVRLYINGIEVASDLSGTASVATGEVFVGSRGGASDFFQGLMSHVYIYNRELTSQEVASLYIDPYQMFKQDNIALFSAATQGAAAPTGIPILRRRRECA